MGKDPYGTADGVATSLLGLGGRKLYYHDAMARVNDCE